MIPDTNPEILKQARDDFMSGKGHPENIIRQEVYDSWIRSRAFHINPKEARKATLSEKQLATAIENNRILYDIASSFLDYLYQIVRGSGFMLIFADQDGYILKITGDEDIIQTARQQEIPLIPGNCRTEAVMGTNAIGTPLFTGKPIQLFSYEHYFELSSNWTCSGAPILQNGQIIGTICMSGSWDKAHTHTLGMVMSASEAISRQLYLTQSNRALTAMRNQLQTTIDSVHMGICMLDEKYCISFVNAFALHLLGYEKEEMLSQPCYTFFPGLEPENSPQSASDIETTVSGKKGAFRCYASIKPATSAEHDGQPAYLLSFRKVEQVRELANKIMGSDARYTFENIIGNCPPLLRLKGLALKVAQGNTNILITGENGTGKELFAQSIHNSSPYAEGPFVAINCGAIPKELIESELFGYDPGAFTGARKEGRAGKFEFANHGTIFLDEIGDMPYDVQVRLLRVLQEKSVTRIGGKNPIPLNVRVIAATNVNLEKAIENHTFRSDLYYRLNVFSLHIPPLRDREDDILLLADYFLDKYQNPDQLPITQMEDSVRDIFCSYPWPGNIRELENVIEWACILATNGVLTMDTLPSNMQKIPPHSSDEASGSTAAPAARTDTAPTASESERRLILEHLKQSGGNVKKPPTVWESVGGPYTVSLKNTRLIRGSFVLTGFDHAIFPSEPNNRIFSATTFFMALISYGMSSVIDFAPAAIPISMPAFSALSISVKILILEIPQLTAEQKS